MNVCVWMCVCAAPRYMLNMETQHGAAPTRATVAAQQNHSAGAAAAAAPVAAPAVAAAASNEDPVATPVATAVNDNAGTPRSRGWVPRASRGSAHFSWRCMQAQRQRKTRCQMDGTGRWMTHSGCTSSTMPSAERRTRTLAFRSRNGLACVRVKTTRSYKSADTSYSRPAQAMLPIRPALGRARPS